MIKERKAAPVLEEGKTELSDEQRKLLRQQENTEGMQKIEEISRLMGEAPKIKFNVNVFRQGVNFDMPADEIRQDEA